MADVKRYNTEKIRNLGVKKLVFVGCTEHDAACVVDSMLEADMKGVSTHGIRMLPGYVARIESGQFSLDDTEIIKQTPAFTTLDARNSVGAVSAIKATNTAIEKALEYGVHVVFSKNCNTYGPAFYYVEKMAESGLIGLTCCNSPAAMPVINGLEQMIGTNPFAFACPTNTKGNIVIDMATSVVAKSRFETARLNREQLQPGWALDKEGNPTTDPIEAIKGFVLPMAGFKGYGIALMIDILSGMLSGSAYLNNVGKFYSKGNNGMNVGHMFIAIDPRVVYEGDFYEDMDIYIETLRSSKAIPGKQIIIPGEDRKEKKLLSVHHGIVLTDDTVGKLEELFKVRI
jgi:LDH2 family malate/lactate/ureidoglycolate dehydrogenase